MGGVTYVESNERNEDPNISPPVGILDVEREVQELVRGPERAEPAIRGSVWIGKVPSGTSDVWIHVLRARHTSRWRDGRIFDVRTVDLLPTEP